MLRWSIGLKDVTSSTNAQSTIIVIPKVEEAVSHALSITHCGSQAKESSRR